MARTQAVKVVGPLAEEEEEEESGTESEHGRPLFEDKDGNPVNFFIHAKLNRGRKKLERDIQTRGGHIVGVAAEANIIIIDETKMSLYRIRLQYGCSQNARLRSIHVEGAYFVSQCIEDNRVEHLLPPKKGMGGRNGGRTSFTDEDDINLSIYISTRLPAKGMGGRCGQNIYIDLVGLADSDDDTIANEYKWVHRHPWHSWRERYKKHMAYFDSAIETLVKDQPPPDQTQYILDRRLGPASRRRAKRRYNSVMDGDNSDDGRNSQTELEIEAPLTITHQIPAGVKRKRSAHGGMRSDGRMARAKRVTLDNGSRRMALGKESRHGGKGKGRASPSITVDETAANESHDSLFDGEMTLFVMDEAGPSGTQRNPSPTQVVKAVPQNSLDSHDERIRRAWKPPGDDGDEVSDSEVFAARLQQMNVSGSRDNTSRVQLVKQAVRASTSTLAHIIPAAGKRNQSIHGGDRNEERMAHAERPTLDNGSKQNAALAKPGPSGTQRSPSPTLVAKADTQSSFDSDDERIRRALEPGDDDDDDDVSDSEAFAARLQQTNIASGSRGSTSRVQGRPVTQAAHTSTPTRQTSARSGGARLARAKRPTLDNDSVALVKAGPSGAQRNRLPTLAKTEFDSDDEGIRRALDVDDDEDGDDMSDSEVFAAHLQMNVSSGTRTNPSRVQDSVTRAVHAVPPVPFYGFRGIPAKPKRESTGRKSSQESAVFPSPGTRARVMKDHLERVEKRTPYKPPPGTRAALLKA